MQYIMTNLIFNSMLSSKTIEVMLDEPKSNI